MRRPPAELRVEVAGHDVQPPLILVDLVGQQLQAASELFLVVAASAPRRQVHVVHGELPTQISKHRMLQEHLY